MDIKSSLIEEYQELQFIKSDICIRQIEIRRRLFIDFDIKIAKINKNV